MSNLPKSAKPLLPPSFQILDPVDHYREPAIFVSGLLDGVRRAMPGWGRIAFVYVNPTRAFTERVEAWEPFNDLNKQLGNDALGAGSIKSPKLNDDEENGVVLVTLSLPGSPPAISVYRRYDLIQIGGDAPAGDGAIYALDNGTDPVLQVIEKYALGNSAAQHGLS